MERLAKDMIASAADETTRSGIKLHIRAVQPADADLMADLFAHVSAADLRFRFLETVKQVGPETLAPMLRADDAMVTFLAFVGETPVACCTLARDPDGTTAEVALSIRSDRKGQGISWTLLDHVLRRAAAAGIRMVTSLESGEYRDAIELEREMGFVARLTSAAPVELSLSKVLDAA